MNILDQIAESKCFYVRDTGREITKIYLGRKEMKEMEKIVRKIYSQGISKLKDFYFDSCKIYEVNEEKHLNVC